jgi:hypothetical protein
MKLPTSNLKELTAIHLAIGYFLPKIKTFNFNFLAHFSNKKQVVSEAYCYRTLKHATINKLFNLGLDQAQINKVARFNYGVNIL